MASYLPAMYTRRLTLPATSFFLFGPRATGKTTWLRQVLGDAHWYDLLANDVYLGFLHDPGRFGREVEALPSGSWVVVDEVQKVPALLDEVHDLISRHGRDYRFALSGSSARKLRRAEANMLAGRVINRSCFPLTLRELGEDLDMQRVLATGLLPGVRSQADVAPDILEAYASNYLRQEIQQEALTKDVAGFSRFLRVAALMNGEPMNASNVAREAQVSRSTVQRHFEILVDTLIGVWVPAWQPRLKVREAALPKFYFFDPGVARAAAGRVRFSVQESEIGTLLETWVLHELRAHVQFSQCGGEVAWYRTKNGVEVDFVWTSPAGNIGIEVKASRRWRSEHGNALREMLAKGAIRKAVGVYLGDRALMDGEVRVLPARTWAMEIEEHMALS